LLMCFIHELSEFGLRETAVFDVELDGKAKATPLAGADRDMGGHARLAGVLFVPLADEIEGTAKTGGVAESEEMFRGGRSGPTGPAHRLRNRKIGTNAAILGLGMTISSTSRRRAGGEERIDLVHGDL